MRLPIGETEIGVFHTLGKTDAMFVSINTDYFYDRNFRRGTYAEFKELYPYDNGNGHFRSKIKTKYNSKYNQNL